MNTPERGAISRHLASMHTWPTWGRWLTLTTSYALLIGGLWLMVVGSSALRVLGLAAFVVAVPLTVHANRAVRKERSRKVDQRYAREFMPAMVAYVLFMLHVWPLQKTMESGWLKVATALLPVLPIAWLIIASIRYVLGCDEMERRQHLEALAVAVAIVSVVSMTLGFLAAAKVVTINGTTALFMVYPVLCFTYGVVHCGLVWRSRAE
ncbi:hypothetical protein [Dyella sp. 20L07]|uniref:hypothetical protein n=1 Tax=Dyella sp. 20L07 TaxID=3384240 RepID=UPI003D28D534